MTKKRQKIKMGCPMKIESAEELLERIKAYFKECQHKRLVPNRAGLCNFVGISRKTFYNYLNNKDLPDYNEVMEIAIATMENFHVQGLYSKYSSGAKFALESQFNWSVEQKIKNTNENVNMTIEEYLEMVKSENEY